MLPKKFNDFVTDASTSKEVTSTGLASDSSTLKKVPPVSLTLDPQSYEETISCPDAVHWIQAMENEYRSILSSNIWELVDLKNEINVVGTKWVY